MNNDLLKRLVTIDYEHEHRHLPGSLSAIQIIARIHAGMTYGDKFILSKGHSCAALYAVLESRGLAPDVSKVHPERDVENGVEITSGSLGHGLPIAVGMAWAKKIRGDTAMIHVLLGDGELQEGTTWEAFNLAARLDLKDHLTIHVDDNGFQQSDAALVDAIPLLRQIFPVTTYGIAKGAGIRRFEVTPWKATHTVTDEEYAAIMEELSQPCEHLTDAELRRKMEDAI